MSRTYDEILSSMQNEFKNLAGFEADDASDIGIRLKVLAGELFSISTNIDWLKNQMFPQTATGTQLDLHAQQRGLIRKAASKSKGTLVFSRPSTITYNITIPVGTICSTAETNGIRFVTTEEAVLKAGELSVSVKAESEVGGANTNVAVGNINVMVTPPAGMGSVTNSTTFTGGTDFEPDEELRDRLLFSYENISNGSNCAFYRDCALSFDGVQSVFVMPASRGTGSIDIYVAGKGGKVPSTLIAEIQSYIDSVREINVDALVKSVSLVTLGIKATVKAKTGYLIADVIEACKVSLANYFNSLSAGEAFKIADLFNAFYNTEGVDNYSVSSPTVDINAGGKYLIVGGTFDITEMEA